MKVLAICVAILAWSGSAAADGTGSTVPGGAPATTPTPPPVATTTTIASSAGGPVPTTTTATTTATTTTARSVESPVPTTVVVRVEVPVVPGGSPVVVPVRECAGAVVVVVLNGLPTGPLQGPQLTVPSSGSTTQTFADVPAGSYTVTIEVIAPGVCGPSTTIAQGSQGPATTSGGSGGTTPGSQGPATTSGGSGGTTPQVASQAPAVTVPSAAARGPAPGATEQSEPLPFTGSRVTGILQAALLLLLVGQVMLGGSRARGTRQVRPKS
jgi:hypothetical protein